MRVPLGYKFIIGFLAVVAVVAFAPPLVEMLGYPPAFTKVLTFAVALTLGLVIGWTFSRRFTRNIGILADSASRISQGDLTQDINLPATRMPDETHELATEINRMVQSLRELAARIRAGSAHLADASRKISSNTAEINCSTNDVAQAMHQIACGAETQAGLVERSSQIIKDTATSIELVASRARESSRAARNTSETARRGSELATEMLEEMKQVFTQSEAVGVRFDQFHGRLQRVGKVSDFIAEVARQTNLLALNASIEAVRAGEYGKGFTVVADEVRKLADSTSQATEEINGLIASLRDESLLIHEHMAENTRVIRNGKQRIDSTADAFTRIIAGVEETERRANSIAELSQIQLENSGQMVKAVEEISEVTAGNAAATEEVTAATAEQLYAMQQLTQATKGLAQLADELEQAVQRFSVDAGKAS